MPLHRLIDKMNWEILFSFLEELYDLAVFPKKNAIPNAIELGGEA